jgi:hypothetical protein
MKLPVEAEIEEGVNPGTFHNPSVDGRKGKNLLPDASHPLVEFLWGHPHGLKNHIQGIVLLPIPTEDSPFLFQSVKRLCSRIRGHDKGEGPVEPVVNGEIDDTLKDPGVIVIKPHDKGSHDTNAVIMDPLDRFDVFRGLIKSFSHRLKVLFREGFKADIEGNTTALSESLKKLRIKGDRDRGMAVPEEIEFLEKGDELKTKAPVPGNIGIDNVEKPPFQKIGEVSVEKREGLLKDPIHDRAFKKEAF